MANVINGIKINDTLYDLNLSSLGKQKSVTFESDNGTTYSLFVDSYGDVRTREECEMDSNIFVKANDASRLKSGTDTFTDEGIGYYTYAIKIGEVFCGGKYSTSKLCAATHNFVMLTNFSRTEDFSLEGLFLLYKGTSDTKFTPIKLHSKIKAGSTYLIRGAKCSNICSDVISVDTYDQEWFGDSGKLIEFDTTGSTFYLCTCTEDDPNSIYNATGTTLASAFNDTAIDIKTIKGYIDLIGVKGTSGAAIGTDAPLSIDVDSLDQVIVTRYNMLDSSTNVNYELAKSGTLKNWTYYRRDKYSSDALPYYTEKNRLRLKPAASFENKTIQDFRTSFDSNTPNHVTCTFGYKATADADGATRCFNWISTGRYDEYIEYAKVSDTPNTKYNIETYNPGAYVYSKKYSIQEKGNHPYTIEYAGDTVVSTFIKVYDRCTWNTIDNLSVTTHKAIIRGLQPGTYLYRICREGDLNYKSEYKMFIVKSTDSVKSSGFSFVHTTDQQGFNINEYKAWEKCAYAISTGISDYDFLINTGDIAQSGSKPCEWLDYYDGTRFFNGRPDMTTLGNNDMGEADTTKVPNNKSKINPMTIWYYNTYELDPDNSVYFTFKVASGGTNMTAENIRNVVSYQSNGSGFTYFCPATYSFNYGGYHFICLNSEMSNGTNAVNTFFYNGNTGSIDTQTFKNSVYVSLFNWAIKDIKKHTTYKKIAYMHEIPLCIIKPKDTSADRVVRDANAGSALNTDFSTGLQNVSVTLDSYITEKKLKGGFCFSEFFQNNGVSLCLGGHKHTYSLTYATKENVTYDSSGNRTVNGDSPICTPYNSSQSVASTNGVVYAMAQATGYKLVSNKELPGVGADWNYLYFPCTYKTSNKASASQYYPTIHLVTCKQSQTEVIPYYIDKVYPHSGTSYSTYETNIVNNEPGTLIRITKDSTQVKVTITY